MSSLLRKVRSSTYVLATSRCRVMVNLMAAEKDEEEKEDGVCRTEETVGLTELALYSFIRRRRTGRRGRYQLQVDGGSGG